MALWPVVGHPMASATARGRCTLGRQYWVRCRARACAQTCPPRRTHSQSRSGSSVYCTTDNSRNGSRQTHSHIQINSTQGGHKIGAQCSPKRQIRSRIDQNATGRLYIQTTDLYTDTHIGYRHVCMCVFCLKLIWFTCAVFIFMPAMWYKQNFPSFDVDNSNFYRSGIAQTSTHTPSQSAKFSKNNQYSNHTKFITPYWQSKLHNQIWT